MPGRPPSPILVTASFGYAASDELRVVPIPGPNAAVTALAASGLPSDEYIYAGFLPAKKNARLQKLLSMQNVAEHADLLRSAPPHRGDT